MRVICIDENGTFMEVDKCTINEIPEYYNCPDTGEAVEVETWDIEWCLKHPEDNYINAKTLATITPENLSRVIEAANES